jgi:hypothetical protein
MAASSGTSNSERCSWCGTGVEPSDGFRAGEHPGERMAVFCRLEHIVPWELHGAHWEAGTPREPAGVAARHAECAQCGKALGDVYVQLVRHRGEHRVPDAFCSPGHMAEWAKGGGRWR